MLRVGITGQSGFVGTHLFNFLGLQSDVERVPFQDDFFSDKLLLQQFVQNCDVIVHLAAMNRHNDPEVLFETNIALVNSLIDAMEQTQSTPHVLFSSSTQEELDNNYGNSKKAGRELLVNWAARNQAPFTGMVIPNVFGPFGNPFYNSVIATFSHLLTHGGQPQIMVDNQLKLIYVGELVDQIWNIISERKTSANYHIPHTSEAAVSEILKTLVRYKEEYFDLAVIPKISNRFELNLFNTFRSYISHNEYFPFLLKKNTDNRGSFVETVKTQKEGQFSYSTTVPGITRGEHFHTRKIERFAVIQGKAVIELRRIGSSEVLHFELDGENPSFVDMPVWYTHNITNTGETTLVTLFWISEFFDPTDTDTFFEKVRN